MKNKQDICVIIQARLESERVPKKMVRPFAGTTLVDILLDKLSSSKVIPATNIYFSVYLLNKKSNQIKRRIIL